MTENEIKIITKEIALEGIVGYIKRNQKNKRKFQILDILIPNERRVRSIVGGLETGLGRTLWEPLAKTFAEINGFEIVNDDLKMPKHMPATIDRALNNALDERKAENSSYNAEKAHKKIKESAERLIDDPLSEFVKAKEGTGVDIWLRKKGVNYIFDSKTVQPSMSQLKNFSTQILHWYAYFYSRYPNETVECRIVFPYNPYEGDFWDNTIGKKKPIEKDTEAWVEDQFWDFCSGYKGTFSVIKETLIEIRDSGELDKEFSKLFKS